MKVAKCMPTLHGFCRSPVCDSACHQNGAVAGSVANLLFRPQTGQLGENGLTAILPQKSSSDHAGWHHFGIAAFRLLMCQEVIGRQWLANYSCKLYTFPMVQLT